MKAAANATGFWPAAWQELAGLDRVCRAGQGSLALGLRVVWLTVRPNASGWRCTSSSVSAPLPTAGGPQSTTRRGGCLSGADLQAQYQPYRPYWQRGCCAGRHPGCRKCPLVLLEASYTHICSTSSRSSKSAAAATPPKFHLTRPEAAAAKAIRYEAALHHEAHLCSRLTAVRLCLSSRRGASRQASSIRSYMTPEPLAATPLRGSSKFSGSQPVSH